MPRNMTSVRSSIGTFLFGAFLTAAVSVTSSPASADWVGAIVTERPQGQAFANGTADMDGNISVGFEESLEYVGHGVATVTFFDAAGSFILERTCIGNLLLVIQVTLDFLNNRVNLSNDMGCAQQIGNAASDEAIVVEMVGAFDCGGRGICLGTQNGKLTFRLEVE